MTHHTTAPRLAIFALTLLASACLLATLAPNQAQAQHLSLRLGGSDAAVTDDAFDFVSDNNFLSLGQLALEASFIDHLWFGVEYQWGREEFSPIKDPNSFGDDGTVNNSLDIDGLMLTARGNIDLLDFLSLYATVGGGFYSLEMLTELAGEEREQSHFVPTGMGLVGVELRVPSDWMRSLFRISRRSWASDLSIGVVLEGGYLMAGSADFNKMQRPEFEREPEPEDRPLDAAATSLGTLDLSGVIMRSALMVRF